VSDPKKVLSEIARVLRPQGLFIFVDHGASPNTGFRLVQTALTSITKYFTGNCHYNRKLEKLIKEAGFEIKKMEHPRERFKPLIYNYQGQATHN
jgi:ubiquinone/menaquinone biosynthesis C-methylase UbiE